LTERLRRERGEFLEKNKKGGVIDPGGLLGGEQSGSKVLRPKPKTLSDQKETVKKDPRKPVVWGNGVATYLGNRSGSVVLRLEKTGAQIENTGCGTALDSEQGQEKQKRFSKREKEVARVL